MLGGRRREIAVLLGVRCMSVGLWRGPEKVKTNTNGGAQRYTSNQTKRKIKVRGNMSDIPGSRAKE